MNYSSYEHRSKRFIYFLAFNANLGSIGAGIFFVALNACIWEVMIIINSQELFINLDRAVLSAAIPFGGIFGGLLASYSANKFGRRKTMMFADILAIFGCAMTLSSTLTVMLIGRIICGFVVGINFMVIPLYLREISPPDMSGKTGSYFRIFFTCGLILTFSVSFGLANPPTYGDILWRIIFLLPLFLAMLRLLIFYFWIRLETPKYYMEKEEEDWAILALEQIFRDDQVHQVYQKEKLFDPTKVTDIFGTKYRSQTLLIILLIFATEFMGATSLNFYTSIVFLNRTNEDPEDYYQTRILNIVSAVVRFLGAIIGKFMIDKIGRRPLLIYGNLISIGIAILITFTDAIEFLIGQQTLVMLYIAVESLTFSLVLPVYASELLPSFGIAVQVVIEMLCILLVTLFFPFVGVEFSFLIFAGVGALSFYPMFKLVKETKGKTINEIYRMFQSQKGSGLLDMEVERDEIEYSAY